jgi:hypothetical protein
VSRPEAFNNRGIALKELKRLDEALASPDQVQAIKCSGWVSRICRYIFLGLCEPTRLKKPNACLKPP